MSVSEKDVQYVAELAHLELTEAERTRMLRDLNAILEHINQLNELDTSAVEPMAQVSIGAGDSLRPDQTAPSLPREEVMASAPESDGIYFKVPKVIER